MTKKYKNYSFDLNHNTLTIDLGDSPKLTKIIVKGKHINKTITIPSSSPLLPVGIPVGIPVGNPKDTPIKAPALKASGDSQTNSGIINHSQFNDGGFGDIGQQWRGVVLKKSTVINNHTSINLTLTGANKVILDKNSFGTGTTQSGDKNKKK